MAVISDSELSIQLMEYQNNNYKEIYDYERFKK